MASVDEMKSRWVYSEIGSPRWGHAYALLHGHTPLLEKAQLHIPFAALSAEEHAQLLAYAPSSSRRGLMGRLAGHAIYRLEHWDKRQLGAAHTTHGFGVVPYAQFYAADPSGEDANDPREAAKHLPYYPGTWEAAIAVQEHGGYMLIDGYTRSVVFMKEAPAEATFAVWVPDE
jgi:hypothetical protein